MPLNKNVSLRLRVMHHSVIALGPGKAELMEAIAQTGSISQAAKNMGMSYRRAWQLVNTMNKSFSSPLVETQTGGSQGGGAVLTVLGTKVLELFRQMELSALAVTEPFYQQLSQHLVLDLIDPEI